MDLVPIVPRRDGAAIWRRCAPLILFDPRGPVRRLSNGLLASLPIWQRRASSSEQVGANTGKPAAACQCFSATAGYRTDRERLTDRHDNRPPLGAERYPLRWFHEPRPVADPTGRTVSRTTRRIIHAQRTKRCADEIDSTRALPPSRLPTIGNQVIQRSLFEQMLALICHGLCGLGLERNPSTPQTKAPTDTSSPKSISEGEEAALGSTDSVRNHQPPQAKAFGR